MNEIKFYAGLLKDVGERRNYFLGTREVILRDRTISVNGHLYPQSSLVHDILKIVRSTKCIPTYADSGDIRSIKYINYYE